MSHANDQSGNEYRTVNVEQAEAWNGEEGQHWVAHRDRYDHMLPGFTHRLLTAAQIAPTEYVLDIGCGSGQTTCAAAHTARQGWALGADLSRPLLDEARQRAQQERLDNVSFEQADAQVHPFPTARFDVAISRFGVMFFADPAAAFANIAQAIARGGRLAFLTWQEATRNEWIATLVGALAAYAELPQLGGNKPGPFSLTDPDQIEQLLHQAGFAHIAIDPVAAPMRLGSNVDDAIDYVQDLVRDLLTPLDATTKAKALDSARTTLVPHHTEDGIHLGAAAWLVTARPQ